MNKLPAVQRGKLALEEMKAEGVKITKNAVSTRGDFNHANFYKKQEEWVELREKVESAEKVWADKVEDAQMDVLKEEVASLKSQIAKLKADKSELKKMTSNSSEERLIVKMTELYRINDKLHAENQDLKNEIKWRGSKQTIRHDETTGEVLEGYFKKPE
ncbi:DUF6262 family protein [Idiomarina loihiensis]|uniref:DUF6262 family protein n=1 Tax=Idiomarina loihiensis TaxID=135577 RepID=UPI0039BE3AD4